MSATKKILVIFILFFTVMLVIFKILNFQNIPIVEVSPFLRKPFEGILVSSKSVRFSENEFFKNHPLDGGNIGTIFSEYRPLGEGEVAPNSSEFSCKVIADIKVKSGQFKAEILSSPDGKYLALIVSDTGLDTILQLYVKKIP